MATKFWSDTQFDESCTFQNTAEFNGSCAFQDSTHFNGDCTFQNVTQFDEDATHSKNINIVPNIAFSFSLSTRYVICKTTSANDYSYKATNIKRDGTDISGAILTEYTILSLTISPTKPNFSYDIKITSDFTNTANISISGTTQTSSATNTFSNLSGENKLTITLSGSLLAAMDQGTIICNSINISIYPQGSGQLILKGVSGKFIVKNDGINIVDESTGINKTPISVQGTKIIAKSDQLYLNSFALQTEVGSYLRQLKTQVEQLNTRLDEQGFKSAPATSIFLYNGSLVGDIKCRIHQSGALVEVIFDESSNFYNVLNNLISTDLEEKRLYIINTTITDWNGNSFYLKKPTAKNDQITQGWTEYYTIKMNIDTGEIQTSKSELFKIGIYYPNSDSSEPYITIYRYSNAEGQLSTIVGTGDSSAIVWRTIV